MPVLALLCLCWLLLPLRAQTDPLAAAQAALAAAEQQHGADSVAALQARLQLGTQLFKAGQLQPAREQLQRLTADARAAAEPQLEASARHLLVAVLSDLHDMPAAKVEAETGLSLRRQLLPAGHVTIAEACNALASVHAALGESAPALELFAEAREIFLRTKGQGMRAAMVSNNLAGLASRGNDFQGAIDHATEAVASATAARGTADRTTLQLRANLGRALVTVGRLDAARRELEAVLDAQRQQLGEKHLRTFDTEQTVLNLQLMTMPDAPAIATATRLLATAGELFGPQHATTIAVRRLLVEAQLRAGDAAAALAHVDAMGADHRDATGNPRSLDLLRARVLADLGRHDEAAVLCHELETAARRQTDVLVRVYELPHLAHVHAAGGRRGAAIALVREVLADPRLELAWTLPLLRLRNQLAEWLIAEGDAAAAARLDADSLSAFGVALDATLPSLLEGERLRQKSELQSGLDRLLAFDTTNSEVVGIGDVFAAVLAWKGCVGRELEADLAALRSRAQVPQQVLRDRLQQLQRSLGEQLERGGEGGAEWRELQRERGKLLVQLSSHAEGSAHHLDLARVQRSLPAAAALVEFVRWQRRGVPWLSAFVLRADGNLQRVELGELQALQQAVAAHLQILSRRLQPLDPSGARVATAAARRVTELCWHPLQAALGTAERVYLAGDDCLLMLPFDSLSAADGAFLLERFDLRHLRSGVDLLRDERPRGGGLLLVDGAGADLPGAHAEVAAIASLWREHSGRPPEQLDGGDGKALAAAAAPAEFVHFATHGRLHRGDGNHGASLELAGQRLSASELAFFDLGRSRLVVLSACDTARGEVVAGEHLLGLRRALRLAGAVASVTALWRIDDDATAGFMVPFWTELVRDGDPAVALRRSKLAALAVARQTHGDPLPGRWAAFMLEGL